MTTACPEAGKYKCAKKKKEKKKKRADISEYSNGIPFPGNTGESIFQGRHYVGGKSRKSSFI